MTDPEAVDEVADDAAADKAEGQLAEIGSDVEVMPAEIEDPKCHNGDGRQHKVVVAEQTPGRAGIVPMHELEKAGNDDLSVRSIIYHPGHDHFGDLVQNRYERRDNCDAAIRRFE